MGMLVKIITFDVANADQVEKTINDASEALSKEGRFVVDMSFVDAIASKNGMPCAILRHMPDQTADYMKKAIDAENAIQQIIDGITVEGDPSVRSDDDIESARANGMDVANWEVAKDLDAVLQRLRA